MNSKIFSLFIFSIFLLSGISAMTVYSDFASGSQSATVNVGQSVSFNADFFSMNPPITSMKVQLFRGNSLIFTFLNSNTNSKTYSNTYTYTANTAGTYEIRVIGTDSVNTDSEILSLTVNPVIPPTNHVPTITLLGNNPVTIIQGNTYTDAGAIATDFEDGILTSSIITSGTVNTNAVGIYTITYSVTDLDSNTATAIRIVFVVSSNQNPQITIISPEQGKEYNIDKTISLRVTTNSVVSGVVFRLDEESNIEMDNPSLNVFTYSLEIDDAGTHFITFYPTDSSGNIIGFGETVSFSVEKENKEEHVSRYPVIITGNENRYSSQFQPSNNYITGAPINHQISLNWVFIFIIALEIALVIILTAFIVFVLKK